MILIDGRVTMLIDENGLHIQIVDSDSGLSFVSLSVNPDNTLRLLGKEGRIPCDVSCLISDKIGKQLITDTFEFLLPEVPHAVYGGERDELARETALKLCPEPWEPNNYFGSRDSFFERDGKNWARCVIRKYVEKDS